MILPRYRIADSTLAGAGKGLFLDQALRAGQIITAPDAIEHTYSLSQIQRDPALSAQMSASARWFEDRYTLSPEWPDECYVNHSFTPTGLWHLGFIFAAADLAAGTEITVDYRHLLPPGISETFNDAVTGETITGFDWPTSLAVSTRALAALTA
ncbi:SET domain-containing protein [Oleiagrimonas sp. C23AA]|uniref:SET domain-containing protein-lysine N-methyltransferase n=1 Tax=Oleiagrimonas sp. C23AA TaxID=2719047 RepID=UPI00141ED05D|nr:SET domain-containing protein [Oleiagrimonas sp. C23AA]NII10063.1 SET domain-containing protein [Oleiagrimonas sp. C23AA]